MQLSARDLTKTFNRRTIFSRVSFVLSMGQVLRVVGKNGSGKSTLVKVLANVLTPSGGEVRFSMNGKIEKHMHENIGFVSPYVQLYDEFTAMENLFLAFTIRGLRPNGALATALIEKVGLNGRGNDEVRTFSSGMKQRLKYAFALIHRPPILILDEPMANLDRDGVEMVRKIMDEQRAQGILIVATNELSDIEMFDFQVDLNAPSP